MFSAWTVWKMLSKPTHLLQVKQTDATQMWCGIQTTLVSLLMKAWCQSVLLVTFAHKIYTCIFNNFLLQLLIFFLPHYTEQFLQLCGSWESSAFTQARLPKQALTDLLPNGSLIFSHASTVMPGVSVLLIYFCLAYHLSSLGIVGFVNCGCRRGLGTGCV